MIKWNQKRFLAAYAHSQNSVVGYHFISVYFVNSCMQYTDAGLYTCSTGGRPHKIPGSYGHYDQDAKTYADWGIECKLDTQYWINTLWVYTWLLCHFAHYRCKNGLVQYKGRWKTAWSKRAVPSNGKCFLFVSLLLWLKIRTQFQCFINFL